MARLFGTDGVRGIAGEELTYDLAVALGRAAVRKLGKRIVIGRDTRISGPMLEEGLCDGIQAEGGSTVTLLSVIPTPGLASYTVAGGFDCGIMITASHNAPEYNGIKFFSADGFKLPDAVEDEMQAIVEEVIDQPVEKATDVVFARDAALGYITGDATAVFGEGCDERKPLAGLKIALDCAHGASFLTTPSALQALGADVRVINNDDDGAVINVACGSTHLEPVVALMNEVGADIAIAHDGDADRMLAVAPDGTVVDGDYILAICAKDMKERGVLTKNIVAGTVMANLGFMQAMEREGIEVVATKVGDRYVLEALRERGAILGGEQSGHVINLDHNTTGDGLMTALMLLEVMSRTGKSLVELMQVMSKFPQSLVNVRVTDKALYAGNSAIKAAEDEALAELGSDGRLLVRESGTEPVIRVMIEAKTQERADRLANAIADVVREQIGA